MDVLVKYFKGEPLKNIDSTCLSPYLLWFDMPTPMAVLQLSADGKLLVKYFKRQPLRNIDSTCLSPYLLWFDMPTPMAVLQIVSYWLNTLKENL